MFFAKTKKPRNALFIGVSRFLLTGDERIELPPKVLEGIRKTPKYGVNKPFVVAEKTEIQFERPV